MAWGGGGGGVFTVFAIQRVQKESAELGHATRGWKFIA